MTQIFDSPEVVCAVCSATSTHGWLQSTNAFGASDLDSRPPEMKRSTMDYWVQQCPECGYCAADISQDGEVEAAEIRTPRYQQQRRDTRYPLLSNAFLCQSILEQTRGHLADSAWSALHAAWVCDDYDHAEEAVICRQRALEMRDLAALDGQALTSEEDLDTALAADLLRRVHDYSAVVSLVSSRLSGISDETIAKVLRFQQRLALNEDARCYTVEDALNYKD